MRMGYGTGRGWAGGGLVLAAGAVCCGQVAAGDADVVREREVARGAFAWEGVREGVVRYEGHRAVRVHVETPRQLMMVLGLTDDVLTCEGAGIGTFDVRFTPAQWAAFGEAGIAHEVLIEDLQAHLDGWWAANEAVRAQDSGFYEAFRDLVEVEGRVDALVGAHPDLAAVSVAGESLEGRAIRVVRVTGPEVAGGVPKNERPAIVINGTQHSRESLSPMVTMFFLEKLLTEYATDPRVQGIVDAIDFYILPMVNPDGYEHVWVTEPMWRKNRRENAGSNCRGVDLNRNWGYRWGQAGSSGDPCSQTFRGAAAFSEPESAAIGAVIDALGVQGRLKAHLDIHSAAQRFLSPWGWTTELPPDIHRMDYLGQAMQNAIYAHRGRVYPYGPGSLILYVVSGGARDYSYGNYGSMSWTLELSGPGFCPPPEEIIPVSVENSSAMLTLAEFFMASEVEGACCVVGGCAVLGPSQCAAAGGMYRGNGAVCGQMACPRVLTTGAANVALTSSGNGGIFLDLTADGGVALSIVQIDTYFNNAIGTPVEFEIWTYPGSYVGRDADPTGWVPHETVSVVSNGPSLATAMPLNGALEIDAGETVGVYILAQSGNLRYTSQGAQPVWADEYLTLFSDRSRSQPWGGTLFTVRTFAGSIHYMAEDTCYANCDGSTGEPLLTVDDFTCFINAFAGAQGLPHEEQIGHYANCDGSTSAPVLTVDDFTCFINAFAAGCE